MHHIHTVSISEILDPFSVNVPQAKNVLITTPVYINKPFRFQVVATDDDSGTNSQLTYSLPTSNFNNRIINATFLINSTNGIIYTEDILYRDNTSQYTLRVRATDHGSPPLHSEVNVSIEVLDWNTHAPIFTNLPNVLNLSKYTCGGVEIFTISATDDDIGNNAQLSFTIITGIVVISLIIFMYSYFTDFFFL